MRGRAKKVAGNAESFGTEAVKRCSPWWFSVKLLAAEDFFWSRIAADRFDEFLACS